MSFSMLFQEFKFVNRKQGCYFLGNGKENWWRLQGDVWTFWMWIKSTTGQTDTMIQHSKCT